jgi:FkbM family methyltransferase
MVNKSNFKDSVEFRVSELQKENDQLLVQLHRAQEELEHGYTTGSSGKGEGVPVVRKGADQVAASVDEEILKAFAENQRLQALVDVQRAIHQIESSNALNVKVGNLLIQGVDGRGALFPTLGKLARIWRQSSRQVPPAALGGKEFAEVIKAYEKGGFALVERLLESLSVSPAMQANAYTVLARELMRRDRVKASEAARRAHELDPKSYRLKWLAFRLHESANVVEAEALLDILPTDTPFSDSEARQARMLHHEAKIARERKAMQRAASMESRAETESKLQGLAKQRDEQVKLSVERAREIETLKNANLKLAAEKTTLTGRCEAQAKLVGERDREIASLKQAQMVLADEVRALTVAQERLERLTQDQGQLLKQKEDENHSLLENVHLVQDELEHLADEYERLLNAQTQIEREKQNLLLEREESARLIQKRNEELEVLKNDMLKVEQEKQILSIEHNVYLKFVETRNGEIETITQAKLSLEQENSKLTIEREVHKRMADARDRELEEVHQTKTLLTQEMQAVTARHEAQIKISEACEREIEVLKRTQARLEQEKQDLTSKHDQQIKTTKTRESEVDTLKKANLQLSREKAAVRTKNQIFAERVGGGDAEIDDFIIDLDLLFGGKAIVYVDVGSYVGDVFFKIKRAAKKFRIHEAHLFEPNPVSYERLLEKVAAEDLQALHTYNLAVGGSSEQQFITAKSMTKSISIDAQIGGAPADVFTARSVSLDGQRSIFTDGKINLLKIDVEGRELDVLASARELLTAQSVDILYIEVGFNRSGTQQTYFAEVDQFLQPLGYRVLRIYEQKEEWMSDSPVLRRANIAYMSERFANAHPVKLMQEIHDLRGKLEALTAVNAAS